MESKTTIYISLIFTAMVVGQLIPFAQIIGAPLSIILLAYFEPYLKTKLTFLIYLIWGFLNLCVFNFGFTQVLINLNQNYLSVWLGGVMPPLHISVLMSITQSFGGYGLIFITASKIIKKSKVRNRYPL